MYDYASDAVHRALPTAMMGGPHTAGVANDFLRGFITHCLRDSNEATGAKGARIDFIAFHAKGSPEVVDGVVHMGIKDQLSTVAANLKTISSIPEAKNLPIIIGESDPEGCAACGMNTHPANAYRNGTLYSSYTAASVARIYDIDAYFGTNIIGAVNWSFEFEGQPWFYGFRDLATNGVDKPVLNVFRMLGMMQGQRVAVSGDLHYDFRTICDSGVRGSASDINALASKTVNAITVLLWNYHDKDVQDEGARVDVSVVNVPGVAAMLYHYRIDANHSNSYETWKKMGSPQHPTADQVQRLQQSGELALLTKPAEIRIENNQAHVEMRLPRQGVSLLKLVIVR